MNKALELFTAVPKMHNCAQSVAAGSGENDLAAKLKNSGGGKAPGGLCGALYAATLLIPAEKRKEAVADFIAAAGSDKCAELKSAAPPFPCAECVRIAADLAEKYRAADGKKTTL